MKDASAFWTNRLPFHTLPRVARSLLFVVFMFAALGSARGQWDIQESHSTANLRGIHSVDGLVAWASGADGTVLRTQDGGAQ